MKTIMKSLLKKILRWIRSPHCYPDWLFYLGLYLIFFKSHNTSDGAVGCAFIVTALLTKAVIQAIEDNSVTINIDREPE